MLDPTSVEAGVMPGDEKTSTEIAERASSQQYAVEVMPLMNDEEIRRTWRVSQALAASGMFKDARQAEQAFAKILLGRDLGLSPTQAMTGINIVEGKPEIAAVTLASFVRRRDGYEYKVVEHTVEKCSIEFIVDGEVRGVSEFTMEDAEKAELTKPTRSGHPSNYVKYPRNMLFARAMSNGIKWFVPEVTRGIPVYHEGEVYQAAIEAPRAAAEAMQLPAELAELVQRAHAIDSRTWRANEVGARLPLPTDDSYQAAVDGLVREIKAWLDENEPQEAEVVSDDDAPDGDSEGEGGLSATVQAEVDSIDAAEAEAGQSIEDVENGDAATAAQERYDNDREWHDKVQVLLNRRLDLDAAGDDVEGDQAARILEELEKVERELDHLGVPRGWLPKTDGSAPGAGA